MEGDAARLTAHHGKPGKAFQHRRRKFTSRRLAWRVNCPFIHYRGGVIMSFSSHIRPPSSHHIALR